MTRKALVALIYICSVGVTLSAVQSEGNLSIGLQEEKEFVIIVPSHNNSAWVDKNLSSIFSQKYDKYRVIYIDDCSTDDTYERVQDYIEQHKLQDRITLIKNKYRKGAAANHFTAGHMCKDYEIIVHVDGDDWLKHEHVLQKLNQVYADQNVLMTYGQYEAYPSGKIGISKKLAKVVHKENIYRECDWMTSALRTFYGWLFKRITLKDFLYYGVWFPVDCDRAIMYPLLEMANERCRFIPDILYVYNCSNSENDYKKHLFWQWHCNHVICSRPKYSRIEQAPSFPQVFKEPKISMIIFSENNPLWAQALLESSRQQISGINNIALLYDSNDDTIEAAYAHIQKRFKNITMYPYHAGTAMSLHRIVNSLLEQANYVLFAHDGILVTKPINIQECVQAMEKTHAYGFYLLLGKNITEHQNLQRCQRLPSFIAIEDDISGWQFECGEYDWKKPHTVSLALYDAHKIRNALSEVFYDKPHKLEELLAGVPFDMTNVGLMYNQSPAIIIDARDSQEHLLALFKQGLKLDISSVTSIVHKSINVSQKIPFCACSRVDNCRPGLSENKEDMR